MNEQRKKDDLFQVLDRADIDIRLVDFVALWYASQSSDGQFPHLSSLMEAASADIGERYFIIDRADAQGPEPTYKYRELGKMHAPHWQVDLTGKVLDEVFPAERAMAMKSMYDDVLSTGQPHYWRVESSLPEAQEIEFERVVVPVQDGDRGVLLGVTYWASEKAGDGTGTRPHRFPPAAAEPTENLEIRVEVEGAPLTVENIVSSGAIADEAGFLEAIAPMLGKLRAGLAVNFGRIPDGMLRLVEGRLDVQVAASLTLLPLTSEEEFLDAMRPYVEAFRDGVLRAAAAAEARPGEDRRWRTRPRFQSFAGFRLQRVSLKLSRHLAETLQEHIGITLPELRIIATLGQDGMQTVSDAASKTLMDRAQVSRTLSKLQEAGYVDKFVDRHDRRVSWLSLTEAGETLWEKLYPVLRERNDTLTRNLSEEDLRTFYRVLEALAHEIDSDKRRLSAAKPA